MNIPGLHVCSTGEDTQTDRQSHTHTTTLPALMVMHISYTNTYLPFVEFFNPVLVCSPSLLTVCTLYSWSSIFFTKAYDS